MSESQTTIKEEILEKLAVLITAAFGLVAALAWNQVITAIFKEVFGDAETIGPMIVYALIVTAFAVILTILVARAASRAKNLSKFSKKLRKIGYNTNLQNMRQSLRE